VDNREVQASIAAAGGIPLLVREMDDGLPWSRTHAAAALLNLALNNGENREAIVQAGAVPIAVRLLADSDPACVEQAAGLLGGLAKGADGTHRAIAESGAIAPLVGLLTVPDRATNRLVKAATRSWAGSGMGAETCPVATI
jgi:hypothetical protein